MGLRLQFVMSKKLTRLFQFGLTSGQAWWFSSNSQTPLRLTPWIALVWDLGAGAMASWRMPVYNSCECTAWAWCLSGSMTMYSSKSDAKMQRATTQLSRVGQRRFARMEGGRRRVDECGSVGKQMQRASTKNMTKIWKAQSLTCPPCSSDQTRIATTPMQCVTLTPSLKIGHPMEVCKGYTFRRRDTLH